MILNTASTGVGNAWAMIVSLVSLPLLLRGLGAEAFGTWVLLQTFSAVTGWLSLADVGIGTATTRLVAERASLDDTESTRTAIATGMALFVGLGFASAALIGSIGPVVFPTVFNTPEPIVHALRTATLFFAAQVFIELITEGIEACLEGLQRVDLSRAVDAIRRTAVAIAATVTANRTGSLSSVAAASCIGSVVGIVAGVFILRRVGGRVARPSGADARGLVRYGRTVALLRPLGVLHRTMDRVIVGAVIGPEAVALVEIATQIQTGAEAVLSATSYAVIPSASWLQARGDKKSVRDLFEIGTKYSLLATSAVVSLGIVFADPFVHVWVGDRYREAAGLAVVALLYVVITAPLSVGSNILLGIGKAGDILKAALLAVVVNLGASIVLVHVVGVVGCFIGSLLGTAALVPLLGRAALSATGSELSAFVRRSLLPSMWPVAALAVVGAAVVALPWSDVVTLGAGIPLSLVAFGIVAVRWSLSRDELRSARRALPWG